MNETKKALPYHMIGGVLSVVLALRALAGLSFYDMLGSIPELIRFAGFGLLALGCFRGKSGPMTPGALGILAAARLFTLFDHFGASEVLSFLGLLLAAWMAVECFTDYMPQYRGLVKDVWFVPTACLGGAFFLRVIRLLLGLMRGATWGSSPEEVLLTLFLEALVVLFTTMWMVWPGGFPMVLPGPGQKAGRISDQEAYCNLVQHILLLTFTCGIWFLVWIYKTTAYLNRTPGEEPRRPVAKLLLCILVPFYYVYWLYESARRMDRLAKENGVPSEITIPCLLMSVLCPVIPPVLLQQRINAVVSARIAAGVADAPVKPAPAQPEATHELAGQLSLPETMADAKEDSHAAEPDRPGL